MRAAGRGWLQHGTLSRAEVLDLVTGTVLVVIGAGQDEERTAQLVPEAFAWG